MIAKPGLRLQLRCLEAFIILRTRIEDVRVSEMFILECRIAVSLCRTDGEPNLRKRDICRRENVMLYAFAMLWVVVYSLMTCLQRGLALIGVLNSGENFQLS
jgi:hypothetical protein